MYSATYDSPIGRLIIVSDGENITELWMDGQKYYDPSLIDKMKDNNDLPVFVLTKQWLKRYFAKERPVISELPLAPNGSEFRQEVWKILCEIPYGVVETYGNIAKKMAELTGKPGMSAQAIGGAVGHNPISIIVPCHRVVGTNGSLTGYAGGIDKKIKLLELEGVDLSKLYVPTKGTAL